MSEEETPTPIKAKADYYNLMKFKLNQVVIYKDQQYTITGWSTNGDGDRHTGVGTTYKYKLNEMANLVQEKELSLANLVQ